MQGMFGSGGQVALEGRLAKLIANRAVLGQEVANIDTPGYQGAGLGAFRQSLATAAAAQLGAPAPAAGGALAPVPSAGPLQLAATATAGSGGGGVLTPDGNGMDMDVLMVDLAKQSLDYQAVARQFQLVYTGIGDAIDAGSTMGG